MGIDQFQNLSGSKIDSAVVTLTSTFNLNKTSPYIACSDQDRVQLTQLISLAIPDAVNVTLSCNNSNVSTAVGRRLLMSNCSIGAIVTSTFALQSPNSSTINATIMKLHQLLEGSSVDGSNNNNGINGSCSPPNIGGDGWLSGSSQIFVTPAQNETKNQTEWMSLLTTQASLLATSLNSPVIVSSSNGPLAGYPPPPSSTSNGPSSQGGLKWWVILLATLPAWCCCPFFIIFGLAYRRRTRSKKAGEEKERTLVYLDEDDSPPDDSTSIPPALWMSNPTRQSHSNRFDLEDTEGLPNYNNLPSGSPIEEEEEDPSPPTSPYGARGASVSMLSPRIMMNRLASGGSEGPSPCSTAIPSRMPSMSGISLRAASMSGRRESLGFTLAHTYGPALSDASSMDMFKGEEDVSIGSVQSTSNSSGGGHAGEAHQGKMDQGAKESPRLALKRSNPALDDTSDMASAYPVIPLAGLNSSSGSPMPPLRRPNPALDDTSDVASAYPVIPAARLHSIGSPMLPPRGLNSKAGSSMRPSLRGTQAEGSPWKNVSISGAAGGSGGGAFSSSQLTEEMMASQDGTHAAGLKSTRSVRFGGVEMSSATSSLHQKNDPIKEQAGINLNDESETDEEDPHPPTTGSYRLPGLNANKMRSRSTDGMSIVEEEDDDPIRKRARQIAAMIKRVNSNTTESRQGSMSGRFNPDLSDLTRRPMSMSGLSGSMAASRSQRSPSSNAMTSNLSNAAPPPPLPPMPKGAWE